MAGLTAGIRKVPECANEADDRSRQSKRGSKSRHAADDFVGCLILVANDKGFLLQDMFDLILGVIIGNEFHGSFQIAAGQFLTRPLQHTNAVFPISTGQSHLLQRMEQP